MDVVVAVVAAVVVVMVEDDGGLEAEHLDEADVDGDLDRDGCEDDLVPNVEDLLHQTPVMAHSRLDHHVDYDDALLEDIPRVRSSNVDLVAEEVVVADERWLDNVRRIHTYVVNNAETQCDVEPLHNFVPIGDPGAKLLRMHILIHIRYDQWNLLGVSQT
jgi:hypothetical protein